MLDKILDDHLNTIRKLKTIENQIIGICQKSFNCIQKNRKIILCGNGGSASDSLHIAAELVGRFTTERRGLPAIALTANPSNITAIGNDYGFEKIFARQLEAIGNKGDLLIGISTSGNSKNIIEAFNEAKRIGIESVCLTGKDGGKISQMNSVECINIQSHNTARIQEAHILVGHMICEFIDDKLMNQ